MLSALAEYSPVIMSVPAGRGADAHADIAGLGAGIALGHVRGALDVARQHVGDALPLAQGRVERVDGGARHAERLRDVFLFRTSTAAIAALILAMRISCGAD